MSGEERRGYFRRGNTLNKEPKAGISVRVSVWEHTCIRARSWGPIRGTPTYIRKEKGDKIVCTYVCVYTYIFIYIYVHIYI